MKFDIGNNGGSSGERHAASRPRQSMNESLHDFPAAASERL